MITAFASAFATTNTRLCFIFRGESRFIVSMAAKKRKVTGLDGHVVLPTPTRRRSPRLMQHHQRGNASGPGIDLSLFAYNPDKVSISGESDEPSVNAMESGKSGKGRRTRKSVSKKEVKAEQSDSTHEEKVVATPK